MSISLSLMGRYTLGGENAQQAQARGLVDADWFMPQLERATLKTYMSRSNWSGAFHVVSWFAALALFGWLGHITWGTWWAIGPFAIYGILYGSMGDSRWHECGHRTAFRTQWLNDAVYFIASFMIFREPESWRWSHARHHSDTLIVGRDNEIGFKRGIAVWAYVFDCFGWYAIPHELKKYALNAVGKMDSEQVEFQPRETFGRSMWSSRVYLAVIIGAFVFAFAVGSFEPLMYIVLPSSYGRWVVVLFGATQHAGLAENVVDHRENTRSVYMNPLFRWYYWNMNYHLEHHLYPSVPARHLSKLHTSIKDQLPTPYPTMWSALREAVAAMRQQEDDTTYFTPRELPTA